MYSSELWAIVHLQECRNIKKAYPVDVFEYSIDKWLRMKIVGGTIILIIMLINIEEAQKVH